MKASRRENSTAGETTTYERRQRDLEARAFRTAHTFMEHSQQLADMHGRQHTDSGTPAHRANSRSAAARQH